MWWCMMIYVWKDRWSTIVLLNPKPTQVSLSADARRQNIGIRMKKGTTSSASGRWSRCAADTFLWSSSSRHRLQSSDTHSLLAPAPRPSTCNRKIPEIEEDVCFFSAYSNQSGENSRMKWVEERQTPQKRWRTFNVEIQNSLCRVEAFSQSPLLQRSVVDPGPGAVALTQPDPVHQAASFIQKVLEDRA